MKSKKGVKFAAVVAALLFVVAIAFPQGDASAQKAKGDKKAAPAKTAPKEEKKKGGGEEVRTRPAELERETPMVGKEVSRDIKADQKRDEAIKTLTEIIQTLQGRPPQKAEMMFQLAELYWEKAKFLYFQEMDDYNKKIEECFKKHNNPEKCEHIKINNAKSRSYQGNALVIYERILREFPDYPRKDEVLFVLGYNKYDAGKKLEGVRHLWDLTKQYPTSRFAPDAYLQLGEHFFNTNNVFKAVQAYKKALEYNDPKTYTFALYKLAWCDYNLGEYDRAIAKFKEVIQISIGSQPGDEKSKIRLRREALNDLVLAFSMVDAVQEARDYFLTVADRNETHGLVDRLGNTYENQGKDELVIETFRMLIDDDSDHPDCPVFQSKIVQAYARMGNKARVMDEMRRLVDNYRPTSVWASKNSNNKFAIDRAYDLAESTLREMVTNYHEQAQKTRDYKTYGLARDIYKEYLDNFSDSEAAYRMRYFYSEILYLMQDYTEAARQYDLVVQRNKEGEFSKRAAYAAVLCWEKLVDNNCLNPRSQAELAKSGQKIVAKKKEELKRFKFEQRKMEKGKTYEKIPLNECTMNLIAASDVFTSLVSDKDSNYLPVKFKIAFIYQQHNHFEEAAKRLGEIITNYPTHQLARRSAMIVLDTFSVQEDWKNLFKYSTLFRENKTLVSNDKKFIEDLDGLIEGSAFYIIMGIYEEAMKVEGEGKAKEAEEKFAQCATEFDAYVKKYAESKYSEKALYNAMVIYDKANKLDLALTDGLDLYERFNSKRVQDRLKKDKKEKEEHLKLEEDTVWFISTFYERITDFGESEKWYQRYVDKYGELKKYQRTPAQLAAKLGEDRAKRISDALFNIALFNEKLGNTKKAISYYEDYIAYFPNKEDVAEVYYNVGLIYQKRKEWAKAKKHFEDFTKKFKPTQYKPGRHIEAMQEVKRCAQALKMNSKDIFKINEQIVKMYEDTPPANRTLIAKLYAVGAMFELLDPKWEEYVKIKLSIQVSKLKKDLEQKAKMLQELQDAYVKILQTGQGDWGLAALFRIGRLYEEFAETLFEAPVPKYLTEDQQMIYKSELEARAFPLEEKAIEAYENVLVKAGELAIYNEWTVAAQDRLRKYRRDAFPILPKTDFIISEEKYVPPEGAKAPVSSEPTMLEAAEEELKGRKDKEKASAPPPPAPPPTQPDEEEDSGGDYGGEDIPSLY
ncbi:MAG: hypothetical protein Kow0090_09690 [Myxococcota bacterium]